MKFDKLKDEERPLMQNIPFVNRASGYIGRVKSYNCFASYDLPDIAENVSTLPDNWEEDEYRISDMLKYFTNKDNFMGDLNSFIKFCDDNGYKTSEGKGVKTYEFKIVDDGLEPNDSDSHKFAYLFRISENPEYTNVAVYVYNNEMMNTYLEEARKGISFPDKDGNEMFRIKNGDMIRFYDNDNKFNTSYNYDDFSVFYMPYGQIMIGNELESESMSDIIPRDLDDFQEYLDENNYSIIPLRSSLPEQCYSMNPETKEPIVIKRGVMGYYPITHEKYSVSGCRKRVNEDNKKLGVTKKQEAAMFAGSMFGWDKQCADPDFHPKAIDLNFWKPLTTKEKINDKNKIKKGPIKRAEIKDNLDR